MIGVTEDTAARAAASTAATTTAGAAGTVAAPDGAAGADGSVRGARRGARVRADAVRNRERIVSAAEEVFVEYGPEAPLDEIARRAGIGNATLYRHFPDRRALVHAVLLHVTIRIADQAEELAVQEADAFTALCRFAHAAVDEKLGALCGMAADDLDEPSAEAAAHKARLEDAVQALMDRARRAGQLREDVTTGDLVVGLSQLTRPLPGVDCPDPRAVAHRHLQLFLDGLRGPAPSELPGAPLSLDDLRRRSRR